MTKSKAENEEDRQDKEEREEDRQEREARRIAGYPDQGLPGRPRPDHELPGFERPVPGETGVERKAREARNQKRVVEAKQARVETEAETLARLERERPAGYEPAPESETSEEKKARDKRNLSLDAALRGAVAVAGRTYQEDNAPPPEPPASDEPVAALAEAEPFSLVSGVNFLVTRSQGGYVSMGIDLDAAALAAAGFDGTRQHQGKIELQGLSDAVQGAVIVGKKYTVTFTVVP